MKYIDYIIKYQNSIRPKEMSISGVYIKKSQWIDWVRSIDNTDLQQFIDDLERLGFDRIITRQSVFDMYKKGLYEGFVYTMLWGGLGILGKENLVNALSTTKTDIESKLTRVKQMIDNNDLENAFSSMRDNKPNKIKGVDISYLTKLLFFLCEDNNPTRKKNADNGNKILPLIYDKWGKNMHISLLIDSLDNEKLFKCKYLNINGYYGRRDTYNDFGIYKDYITLMNKVANELGKRPGEIEEFLFGYPKDRKNNPDSINAHTNPRVFSELYINKYCDYLIDINPKKEWSGIEEKELTTQTTNKTKKGDKQAESKKKDNKKQTNNEESSIDINYDKDRENFIKKYPNLNVFDSTKKIHNRKVFWGCDLSENLFLYVGRTYDKRTFCSIYRKGGIPQTIIQQLNDLLPKSYEDWIGKYCNYEEAVLTLYQVIDRLIVKKN